MLWTEGVELKDEFYTNNDKKANKVNRGSLLTQFGFEFIQRCKDENNQRLVQLIHEEDKDFGFNITKDQRKRDKKGK